MLAGLLFRRNVILKLFCFPVFCISFFFFFFEEETKLCLQTLLHTYLINTIYCAVFKDYCRLLKKCLKHYLNAELEF